MSSLQQATMLLVAGALSMGAAAQRMQQQQQQQQTLKIRQYCVIGAGPAGLQLGHFFKHAGRDYVIFERDQKAGSFFARYPRHRNLISLNKRFVRKDYSEEFAFRHDWNSLIDVRDKVTRTRPVTQRSKALFPHADVLTEYLSDFAEEQHLAIQYSVAVTKVSRPSTEQDGIFMLELVGPQMGTVAAMRCREVIVASGLWTPRGAESAVDGAAYTEGYENVEESGEAYEGKSVMVMGLGNAALETAQELQKYTAEVHVVGRPRPLPEGGEGVRFAHQTHYVGDIRAGRVTILDTYLLKSLDTFQYDGFFDNARLVVIPCQQRHCVWRVLKDDCVGKTCKALHDRGGQNLTYKLPVAVFREGSDLHRHVKGLMQQYETKEWMFEKHLLDEPEPDARDTQKQRKKRRDQLGIDVAVFGDKYVELSVTSKLLRQKPQLADELATIRALESRDFLRYPMDNIIRCFGWAMDTSIFDASVPVETSHKGKYPVITPLYEAKAVPGLFFAGTLGHGLDFRKSAGGFIHGFRYTARALFRHLEEQNFAVPWPYTMLSSAAGGVPAMLQQLAHVLQRRINEASGPYQMFQTLGDIVIFQRAKGGELTAKLMEEMPLAHAHKAFWDMPRLVWVFKYADDFHGPKVLGEQRVGTTSVGSAELSNFLHPQITFFPAGQNNASMSHYQLEDVFTQWTGETMMSPLAHFLQRVINAIWKENVTNASADMECSITQGGECNRLA